MGYKAMVKDGYLNLREETDTQSERLAKIPKGTSIDVLDIGNSEWVRAAYQEKMGYVMHKFLTKPEHPSFGVEGYERYGAPLLKNGSRGDFVAILQQDLRAIRWHDLEVDGIFGPDTEKAVMDYQEMRHLQVDGKAGVETKGSLFEDSIFRGDHGHHPGPHHPRG